MFVCACISVFRINVVIRLWNLEKFDSFQYTVILSSIEYTTDTLIDVVLVKIQYFLLNVDCYIF